MQITDLEKLIYVYLKPAYKKCKKKNHKESLYFSLMLEKMMCAFKSVFR